MAVDESNIVVWNRNGIEYVYPVSIMADIFACSPERVNEMVIQDDSITLNGITKTKAELATEVIKRLDRTVPLPEELETN